MVPTYWFWQQTTDHVIWVPAIGLLYRDSIRAPGINPNYFLQKDCKITRQKLKLISDISRVQKFMFILLLQTILFREQIPSVLIFLPIPSPGPIRQEETVFINTNGSYSPDSSVWTNAGTFNSFSPGPLQKNHYFRRQVTSTAYCAHTSNTVKVTVLPSITNNIFCHC